ncbi:hypothetical protein B0J13DRAFT_576865 [Dactylonectria estremocensis]|uniref:Zn(2)-C6 fungal-type domain-containing protein n=1 Tax=Dactylonectria estremocensis TaxID=1079267 RepID=A0A9P9D2F0_9HYPO|nr:hypothetical protein B0J13DRAFT_576865 [Dactylonectria estremocensis]
MQPVRHHTERPNYTTRWGAACEPCSSAKTKCIRQTETPGTNCERCERLSKECIPHIHRRRKNRVRSRSERYGEIVRNVHDTLPRPDLLQKPGSDSLWDVQQAGHQDSPEAHLSNGPLRREDNGYASVTDTESHQSGGKQQQDADSSVQPQHLTDSIGDEPAAHDKSIPSTYNCCAPPSCFSRVVAQNGSLEMNLGDGQDEDDSSTESSNHVSDVLATYRRDFYPLFPFVVVPDGITAHQLNSSKPFLWAVVRIVVTRKTLRASHAGTYQLLQYLVEHAYMRSERSLDLLQGCLVMVSWYHSSCLLHTQLNNLLYLARSLVQDMSLSLWRRTGAAAPASSPCYDMLRATLGVWYINSTVSVSLGSLDPMRFSPLVQSCVQQLEMTKHPSNSTIVKIVRLQHLTERIATVSTQAYQGMGEPQNSMQAPASMYRSLFRGELEKIEHSLTTDERNNKFIATYVNTVSLSIHEPPKVNEALLAQWRNDANFVDPHFVTTLDIFYQARTALRNWFSAWLQIPASSYITFPLHVNCHMIYALTMLNRWGKLAPRSYMQNHQVLSDESLPTHSLGHQVHGYRSDFLASNMTLLMWLKEQISSQPELHVDIRSICRDLITRFRQASQIIAMENKERDTANIWDLICTKVAHISSLAEQVGVDAYVTPNSDGGASHEVADMMGEDLTLAQNDNQGLTQPKAVPPATMIASDEGVSSSTSTVMDHLAMGLDIPGFQDITGMMTGEDLSLFDFDLCADIGLNLFSFNLQGEQSMSLEGLGH